eukprot:gene10238-2658_t
MTKGKKHILLKEVNDSHWKKLKADGVDIIWLMGLWKVGDYALCRGTDIKLREYYGKDYPDYSMEDIIGSPYAVVDYTVNPEIGTDQDVIDIRKKFNDMGLELMTDFVPNHSAVDCDYAKTHPEYFVLAPPSMKKPYNPHDFLPNGIAYGKDPYSGGWIDTIQWNVWNPTAKLEIIKNIVKVASMSDHIRVDMAMLLINNIFDSTWGNIIKERGWQRPSTEFWSDAISIVKQRFPKVKFTAEVYWDLERTLLDQGFDFVYDKSFYDILREGNTHKIKDRISHSNFLGQSSKCKHIEFFEILVIENHDEPRAVHNFHGVPRANAAAMISFLLPGMRFHHHGQWVGKKNRLVVQLKKGQNENDNQQAIDFYKKFLPISNHEVFKHGEWKICKTEGDLLAWRFEYQNHKRLVVINYSHNAHGAKITGVDNASGSGKVKMNDLMTGRITEIDAEELRNQGIYRHLNPFQGEVFEYQ